MKSITHAFRGCPSTAGPIKIALCSIAFAFTLQPVAVIADGRTAILKTVITMVVGAGAVGSAANGAEAGGLYKQKTDVIRDLNQRGLSATDGSVYQIYFQIKPDASGRWLWLWHPNVYALVQLEGQGDYVPASIAYAYAGQKLSVTVYGRQVRPGGRILVHILDDKSFFNTVWNSILQSEIHFVVAGIAVTSMMAAKAEAGGSVRLLNKDVVLVPPGYMATADITVPKTADGIWLADAKLYDGKGADVGYLQFGQIWRADPSVVADLQSLLWRMVFWGGLALVLGMVFVSQVSKKKV